MPRLSILAFALALVWFAVKASSIVFGADTSLLLVMPDDAFYYLQIAKHLAAEGRSTADGFSNTNGYHPLWMIACVALARVFSGWSLVRAALGLSLLLHVVASLLIVRLLSKTRITGIAWAAGTCWLINPLAYTIALQSVEAGVYTVLLVLAIGEHLRLSALLDEGAISVRAVVRYAAMLGLLVLARTEAVILVACALTWVAWRLRFRSRWLALEASAASTAVLMLAPWFLFSLWQVGTIVQDSGAMKALWTTDRYPFLTSRIHNVFSTVLYFGPWQLQGMTAELVPLTGLLALSLAAVAVLVFGVSRSPSPERAAARALAVALTAVAGVYAVALVDRQVWWLALPALVTVLSPFLAMSALRTRTQQFSAVVLVALSAGMFAVLPAHGYVPRQWQVDSYTHMREIDAALPAGARLGIFNVGVAMYFGSGRQVALDGLVSHDARIRWAEHRFDAYLRERDVQYIADESMSLERALRFSERKPILSELASYPLTDWPTGRMYLWKVTWP